MWIRIISMVLIVAGSTGCRMGATAISEEELQVLAPPGMHSSTALQLISGRGYRVNGPEIRDLAVDDFDANGELRHREWIQRNIATCWIKLNSDPFDLVTGSHHIDVVIDDNGRVEETISRASFTGP